MRSQYPHQPGSNKIKFKNKKKKFLIFQLGAMMARQPDIQSQSNGGPVYGIQYISL